ncbi:unnamed protein product [Sphagnum jensenii]|uniref:Band 7 domain-containing protein n=1 Tax=Sphagnum jensenii TaxID=128206 RepID=A0ABP0V9M2_9BRYO
MHPRSCLPPAAATKSAAAAAAVVAAFAERVLHFQGGSCSTVGMVEKWGRFSYVAQAGLHCLNPVLGEWMAGRLSLRVQSLDVRCDTKTKDNVFVAVVYSIQCRVVRQIADDAFYELQNPRDHINPLLDPNLAQFL